MKKEILSLPVNTLQKKGYALSTINASKCAGITLPKKLPTPADFTKGAAIKSKIRVLNLILKNSVSMFVIFVSFGIPI